jgi:hypothetical protein
MTLKFIQTDGGRAAAGFKGEAGDCAARAVAIAADIPYREAYDALRDVIGSTPRNGVYVKHLKQYLDQLGWTWTPTMGIGTGCTVHMRADELPAGNIIVRLSKHYAAVIDGVLHDTYDTSRDGTRCVYGYWSHQQETSP